MKVIGAGLPRTGTLSQKVALEMLGLGPCYHMVNVLADLPLADLWSNAMDGDAGWDAIFGEHQSTVDWPGSLFYRELTETYPDAKIVLSTRDPEAWEKSMRDTIWELYNGDSAMTHLSRARERVDPDWRAFTALMQRMLAAAGMFTPGRLEPGAPGPRDRALRGTGQARRSARSAAFLERYGGVGAAVRVPRGRRARHAVSAAQRQQDVVDRVVLQALIVLHEWRARDGAEVPVGQPA